MDETRCWQAVVERDKGADGEFVYGVTTTGVFCRPGCGSRTPRRENVRFYGSAAEAAAEGLRACKRCKPAAADAEEAARRQMQEVCGFIRGSVMQGRLEERTGLKLEALAERAGMSAFHFQRKFKAVVGVTPRQYVEAIRMQTLKENLRAGETVTQAIYGAGFGAGSPVYHAVDTRLGMTPKQYRAGGADVEITWATAETALGKVMIGATDRGLCFLEFGETEAELLEQLAEEYPAARREAMAKPYSAEYAEWMAGLRGFLEGEREMSRIPLAVHGTAFQRKVWRYLQTIPAGSVQSYAEVAQGIGEPKAARAVANACGANRIAVVIPCHRVIRGDGGLGGYRWGMERKRALLDAERKRARAGAR